MKQVARAVFERGVLRPLSTLDLREGKQVTIAVETGARRPTPDEIIALAHRVYDGLTPDEIADIESHVHRPLDMFADLD